MMMISHWRKLFNCGLLVVLTGCQAPDPRAGFYSSPLQPGDTVDIPAGIPVPAGQARVYLQHGRLLSYGGTDQYTPFCYFRLDAPLPVEQAVGPGTFEVQSVWLEETTVSLEKPTRLVFAGVGFADGWLTLAYQFHILLAGAAAPGFKLVCSGAFDSPALAKPIRLPEVREALGAYVEVTVRASPAN
jgi:hypothetical protein